MLFNSFDFLLFYPIVALVFFLLQQRVRWFWLLAASCYFYMFFIPIYIVILAATILIDYYVGIYLEKTVPEKKKSVLIVSILINVGILAIFKYYNFFVGNWNMAASWGKLNFLLPYMSIALPVGLSFHTFQAMSYTIEVYRGNQKAERHFGIYALYVMFYPQLVAGPIERPQNVLHQFHEKKIFSTENLNKGLCLMLWGFFKKTVIADRLGIYTNAVYDNYTMHNGLSLALATVFFAIQIYCDFSGYSDIAIGCAKTMGFDLMKNFNRPYFATSIIEFWRRWHISLSSWFRDYLYIPLGGNRKGEARWIANVFIVFLVSGFWHGANWTYVAWGALHGVYNMLNIWLNKFTHKATGVLKKIVSFITHKSIAIPFTFVLVSFAWVFFRANNISQACYIIHKIITNWHGKVFNKTGGFFIYATMGIAILFFKELKDEYGWNIHVLSSKNYYVRLAGIIVLLMIISLTQVFNSSQFIYFQF